MKIRLFYPPMYITLIMSLLLILSALVSLYSIKELNMSRNRLADVYKLQNDVLRANIALRNAAIAPDKASAELELSKMLATRNSATDIYDRLSMADLDPTSAQIVKDLKQERPEYRDYQAKVIYSIRTNAPDNDLWHQMYFYQTLMDRYLSRLDKLLQISESNIDDTRMTTVVTVLTTCLVSLSILVVVILRTVRLT